MLYKFMKNVVQRDSTHFSVYSIKKGNDLVCKKHQLVYSCTHLFLFVLITLINKTTLFIVSLSLAIRKLKRTMF